jgi:elongation factor Tu
MDEEPTRALANVRLLTPDEGGRSAPIPGGTSYRPNHNFFDAGNRKMVMGLIDVPNGPPWLPGHSRDVEIVFLTLEALNIKLEPGKMWRIQEGAQFVGVGAVIRVLGNVR